jgi:DNA-binding NarL/FixJ family response regulator
MSALDEAADSRTRVVVSSDTRLYRDGLELALGGLAAVDVVASTATGAACVTAAAQFDACVVLLDVSDGDSVETVRQLRAALPSVRTVAIAAPACETILIALAEAGVVAYVTRDESLRDLTAAISSAACGEAHCSARITALLLSRLRGLASERGPRDDPTARLTPREREILGLVAEGCSNKQVALALCIEVATVKNHVHNILEQLDVSRRSEAAALMRGTRAQLSTPGSRI